MNANRYALTTWWREQGYDAQYGSPLDFHGRGETNIRPPTDEAFALAVSLKTGIYDPRAVGVPREVALARAIRLISSLAARHRANRKDGWGNGWQTAEWATSVGFAGWLLWDDLSPAARAAVQNMVTYESNRWNAYTVPSYQSPTGKVNYPGDTKAEENAWNGMILQLATAMMPAHPNRDIWRTKMLEFMLSAFARPSDVFQGRVVHARPLHAWLRGSNINEDGTLVNQGRIHPDYMTTVTMNLHTALAYGLAGLPVPRAALFNTGLVYHALTDGGADGRPFYRRGSDAIEYPRGSRWGVQRRMHFALLDVQARAFGFDHSSSRKAAEWEWLHAETVLAMQRRSSDRRTYLDPAEDRYFGREAWVADLAAQAYLTKWLKRQNRLHFTDEAYPYRAVSDE